MRLQGPDCKFRSLPCADPRDAQATTHAQHRPVCLELCAYPPTWCAGVGPCITYRAARRAGGACHRVSQPSALPICKSHKSSILSAAACSAERMAVTRHRRWASSPIHNSNTRPHPDTKPGAERAFTHQPCSSRSPQSTQCSWQRWWRLSQHVDHPDAD